MTQSIFSNASGPSPLDIFTDYMKALWKGAISFGLVTIPVSLYPATRREELKFRLLRKSDQSPFNYKRIAEAHGKEVPWDQIVKGYEYEKGKFVIIKMKIYFSIPRKSSMSNRERRGDAELILAMRV